MSWKSRILGLIIFLIVVGVPALFYRATYTHGKRLRVVTPGKMYRSGQLTGKGFRDAFKLYQIATVINLQEEARDPLIPEQWLGRPLLRESEVCSQAQVQYISLDGGVLDHPDQQNDERPLVIDEFLNILDQPEKYRLPMLIHCKAGLHRTGLLTAIYRMEYENWSKARAVEELRANGFGTFTATAGNVYLEKFISDYVPGQRKSSPRFPREIKEPK